MQEFVVTVAMDDANSDPYIVSVAPTQAAVGRPYIYQAMADDDDGDTLTYLVENADPQNPVTGLNFDPQTGQINWTPTPDQVGTHSLIVRAFDNRGGQSVAQTVTVNVAASPANSPPEIQSDAPTSVDISANFVYRPDVFDANGDPLTFSLPVKPQGMAIDPATGAIGWKPTPDQSRQSWDVVLLVRDPYGAFDIQQFEVSVGPKNTPPQFTSMPSGGRASVGHELRYDANAFDQDGDTLEYSLDAASLAKNIQIDGTTGVLTWTPGVAHLGQHTISITAADGFGGKAVQTFQLVVNEAAVNQPPSILTETLPSPAVAGKLYHTTILASDPEGDMLTFLLDQGPAGMAIDPITGVLTWTPTAAQVYAGYEIIVSVRDSRGGGRAPASFTLDVVASTNNQPPQIVPQVLPAAYIDTAYAIQIEASDPDWDQLGYAVDTDSYNKGI